jgi:hypothetical protein
MDVDLVYCLRKLGERRRQLAWRSVRKRVIGDLAGGASLARDLLREPNRGEESASGTKRPRAVSDCSSPSAAERPYAGE